MADDDKVFLITGASSGIGAATARRAAEAGFRLVLAARSVDKLQALAGELGGDERALAVACDVTDWSRQEAMVAQALEHFGRLDVAFANAGFGASRGFLSDDPEHWREMVLTNVLGAAYTVRATLTPIKEATGHILLTGSVAGRRAIPGSLYSSTKWAISGMGESLRQDVDGTGIRVTVIEPGMVETPFFDNPGEGRLEADDIARAVMFAIEQPPHVDVNDQSAAAASPTRRRRCGARARPSCASALSAARTTRPRVRTSAARASSRTSRRSCASTTTASATADAPKIA
jgi:NADP-dependent 3-hydroxy acid dehydrogenase YdfG